MAVDPTQVELSDYLGVIRRRAIVVGAVVVVCVLLGAAYGLTRPDVYAATAQVALPDSGESQSASDAIADVQTELLVVTSELVAERAAADIPGDEDTRNLLGQVAAISPSEARVLSISFFASEPEEAQVGAQAFAEAYTAQKEAEQEEAVDEQVATFQERIDAVEAGRDEQIALRDEAEPDSVEESEAQEAIDDALSTLRDLTTEQTAVASTAIDGGIIITPARLPQDPQPRGLAKTVAAALALGLLLGLGAAFVLDRLDTRVRSAADLERILGARTLGTIPRFAERLRPAASRLVTVHAPAGPEADAFRRLRTSVLLAGEADGIRTLAITSAIAHEGKTTVAANLAVALAQGGRRVVLIGADLRRPGIEDLFGLPAAPGLSDLLLGHCTIDDVEHQVGDLTVITRGSEVDTPTDLLGSETTTRAILELGHGFDHVLVDTPPVLAVADVLVLAPTLDATLMVVSLAQSSSAQVAEAGTELALAGAKVLGTTLNNDTDTTRRAASAYAYGIRS